MDIRVKNNDLLAEFKAEIAVFSAQEKKRGRDRVTMKSMTEQLIREWVEKRKAVRERANRGKAA